LFSVAKPQGEEDFNPNSLESIEVLIEASVSGATVGDRFQFERNGYFILDADSDDGKIFNRIITLRDTWAKIKNK
jgi:glutaminyl-tRNA synthetase